MSIVVAIIVGLIISAVAMVLSELLRPKPKIEEARPKGQGDFQFPTAIEGRKVPIVFGTVKLTGPNVVWYGDFRQVAVKHTVKTGMWSKKRIVRGYRYYFGMQLAICRGEIDALLRIWVGDKVVATGNFGDLDAILVDDLKLFGGDDFGGGGMQGEFDLHVGTETALADVYLLTQQGGASTTPGYRGTAYVVWRGPAADLPSGFTAFSLFGLIGNQTTIEPWAFEVKRIPTSLGGVSTDQLVNGFDSNPMQVVFELLTDTDWGFGFPSTDVDVAGFLAAQVTLKSEGNGFSFILDRTMEAVDFLKELERQVGGIVFFDQITGLFKINLARGGFDIDTIPQVDASPDGNVIEVKEFTRGTWEETVNQVRVAFTDRSRDYFDTFTPAPDLGNQRIQGGEQVISEYSFPGVKDAFLASKLATRELMEFSVPIAKATVVVDRSLFALAPVDAVAFTDPTLNITKLAMRILNIDFGSIDSGKITLALIQDTFGDFTPFTVPNDDTLWVPPVQEADPIPLIDSLVFEAPRGFMLARDNDGFPGTIDRIWAGGRAQTGTEVSIRLFNRNDPTDPSTQAFVDSGEVFEFFFIGTLGVALSNDRANPSTGPIRLDVNPDSLADLLEALNRFPTPAASDIGNNLVNLIQIEGEFLAVTSVVDQTTFLDLETVYSGLLDTVVVPHALGVPVFLLFVGGGLTDATIPRGNKVDFQLRPESRDEVVSEFSAPIISLTMTDRARRPYSPNNLFLNGVRYEATVELDDQRPSTSGLDNRGIDVFFQRRDFRTTDEVQALGTGVAGNPPVITDAEDIDASFPLADATKYRIEVIEDPLGTPVTLFTTAFNAGERNVFLSRTKILRENGGAVPAALGIEIETQHDFEGETFLSAQRLVDDFASVSTILANDTNMGVVAQSVISAVYTMPTAGPTTITLNLGVALSTGDVEARVNGGTFNVIIASGLVTGTIAGIVLNDTIEVRHTQSGIVPTETFLELSNPASTVDGYAILTF